MSLVGRRFGRLVVTSFAHIKNQSKYWLCQCDCGEEVIQNTSNLNAGRMRSCGCLRRELNKDRATQRNTTHGLTKRHHHELAIWSDMISRCTNPKNKAYHNYGGRGVSVCSRWMSFPNFLADMGSRPKDMTLERINNDGNYEPGNCKWATREEQANNRRGVQLFEFRGERGSVTFWARRWKCCRHNLTKKLKRLSFNEIAKSYERM